MYSSFKNNIWGAAFADVWLISKFNKRLGFLLCVINIYSKHAWIVSMKGKKGSTITNAFQKN